MAESKPTHSELAAFGKREFEALLTEAEVMEYEATQDEIWGTRRRMALAALMRSKAQLSEGQSESDHGELHLAMAEEITEWKDHLATNIKLAETAVARLLSVVSQSIFEPQGPAAGAPPPTQ
jgi:hypothetical protein